MNIISDINHKTYESTEIVDAYKTIHLQPAETIIFFKYKTDIDNKTILDIGCGAGRTSHYLSKFTTEYTGLDYSAQMIAWCKSQYPGTQFIHGDARTLNQTGDNSVDFVLFSYNGVDYLKHDDRMLALKEIHRVLKPGGLFVFSSHNLDSITTRPVPQLEFSLNPISLLSNIHLYMQARGNRKNNLQYELKHDDYELINDVGENFGLVTYYINTNKQVQQLTNAGFTTLELFDIDGVAVNSSNGKNYEPAAHSSWINYISRKNA